MSEPVVPPRPPAQGGTVSENRGLMIVLAYLWILFLVPLLVEKDDREVQWHAKHGAVLFVGELILWTVLFIVSMVPVAGCAAMVLYPIVGLGMLVIRILCIVKGINGERFLIPGVSQYADRF